MEEYTCGFLMIKTLKFSHLHATTIVITFLLPSMLAAQRLLVYPCIDFEAIRWIRHPEFCDQYYICHFGQPLSMPACPTSQVWSNSALNCVPRHSRWDDCDKLNPTTSVQTTDPKTLYTVPRGKQSKKDKHVVTSENKSDDMVISIKQLPDSQNQKRIITPQIQSRDVKNVSVIKSILTTKNPLYYAGVPKVWHLREGHGQQSRETTTQNILTTVTPVTHSYWTPPTRPPSNQQLYYRGLHRRKFGSRQTRLETKLRQFNIHPDHECLQQPGVLLPHPEQCHWYINCSLANLEDTAPIQKDQNELIDPRDNTGEGFMLMEPYRVRDAGVFVWECRYPQLFDDVTGKCREFMNVDCQSRFEPVDQCEYSARQCTAGRCIPCERRFGRCRGRSNGVYPLHPDRWTPVFVTCYKERNIAQDECTPPTPIFSPEQMDCVSLFEVPKQHGGFLPDCSTRPDGYYPDEQGRCAIFFRCALGHFRGYDECPPGSVFDPAIPACQPFNFASRPCGEGQAPLCGGKLDGYYADPYGRCTHYFQCKQGIFQQYFTCDLGIFDPLTQRCVVSAELTVRPCGIQPSPCEALPTGVYPDQATGCKNFIECHHGNMITNGTCERGTVFSAITGRCDKPENAPPPCGISGTCIGKPDGRYPALTRGCSFFYECYHGEFVSLRRCTAADGGFFFNPDTGTCDYPQNICPPCGYRWWGCPRTYQL